jgi:hypothetical protein
VTEHLPLIVVEIVMVFGGALAFAWWQLRDLDREKKKRLAREQREQIEQRVQAAQPEPPAPSQQPPRPENGHAS